MTGDYGVFPPLSPKSSNRASPFHFAATGASQNAMAAPTFLPPSQQPFKSPPTTSQPPFALSMTAANPFDRDAHSTKPIGTPFATSPSPTTSAVIRRLPGDTTEDKLRLMLLFSKELVHVSMIPPDQPENSGLCSAIVKFKSANGAQQAKDMLHGKSMLQSDIELAVDILSDSPGPAPLYPIDNSVSASSGASSVTAAVSSNQRQPSRFASSFQTMEKVSPPMNGAFSPHELPNPDSSVHYQSLFSPQSPIGNHLSSAGTRISGKTLINHDTAEDDETRELLKDPVGFAENGHTQHRRSTVPQLPTAQLASLSLNTSNGSSSLPSYGHHAGVTPISAHGNGPLSPSAINNTSHSINYQLGGNQHFQRHNFPPVNPADQNPPCNTLYVGNLPIDTSEEELKAMFSKQRGYKRLCFRTKQNGPMCFVEFEDISFATKALNDLYGQPLHNSIKGGIRLSFSKNPLGVRSGQSPGQTGSGPIGGLNGMMAASSNGFTTANGPPPGLQAPPGLNRMAYSGSAAIQSGASTPYSAGLPGYPHNTGNPWNNSTYHGPLSAGGAASPMAGSSSSFPSYMMGR